MFDIGYKLNEVVSHADLCTRAKCGCMGGIRYSKVNNVLVLLMKSNGHYDNYWNGEILHYMGSGKGNQSIERPSHLRIINAKENDTAICLFEWIDNVNLKYLGRMVLVEKPRIEKHKSLSGEDEKKVIFLLRREGEGL